MAKKAETEFSQFVPVAVMPLVYSQSDQTIYDGRNFSIYNNRIVPNREVSLIHTTTTTGIVTSIYKYDDTYIYYCTDSGVYKYNMIDDETTTITTDYTSDHYSGITALGSKLYIGGLQSLTYRDDIMVLDTTDDSICSVHPSLARSAGTVTMTMETGDSLTAGYYRVYVTLYNKETGVESYPIHKESFLIEGAIKQDIQSVVEGWSGAGDHVVFRTYRTLNLASPADLQYSPSYLVDETGDEDDNDGDVIDQTITVSVPDSDMALSKSLLYKIDLPYAVGYAADAWTTNGNWSDDSDIISYGGHGFILGFGNRIVVCGGSGLSFDNVVTQLLMPSKPLKLESIKSQLFCLCEDGLYEILQLSPDAWGSRPINVGVFENRQQITSTNDYLVFIFPQGNDIYKLYWTNGHTTEELKQFEAIGSSRLFSIDNKFYINKYNNSEILDFEDAEPTLSHKNLLCDNNSGSTNIYSIIDTVSTGLTSEIIIKFNNHTPFITKFFKFINIAINTEDLDIILDPSFSIDGITYISVDQISIDSSNRQPINIGIPDGANRGKDIYIKLNVSYDSINWELLGGFIAFQSDTNWY